MNKAKKLFSVLFALTLLVSAVPAMAASSQTQTDISKATVTVDGTSYAYTGSEITPNVTVSLNGNTLKLDTDYTVAYSDNKIVGTATVTVTGKGSYTGTKSATFEITKTSVTFTNASKTFKYKNVKKKKQTFSVIKAPKGVKVTYKVIKGTKKYISVSKKGVVTVKKGATKGTYKVKVTVAGTKNYKTATKTITIKVK